MFTLGMEEQTILTEFQYLDLTNVSVIYFVLLFQETKAVHLCVGSGSHIRVYQPWIVNDYGYTTSVVAKLVQVEATTSLAYRPLVEAEELGVSERGYF